MGMTTTTGHSAEDQFETVAIPTYQRALKAAVGALVVVVGVWFILHLLGDSERLLSDDWGIFLPLSAQIIVGAAVVFQALSRRQRRQMTTAAKAQALAIAAEQSQREWEWLRKHWGIRYAVAAGLVSAAAWALSERHTGAAVVFGIGAALLGLELTLAAVSIAAICWVGSLLYHGIATLPVSVAVVIGAFIIAGAVRK